MSIDELRKEIDNLIEIGESLDDNLLEEGYIFCKITNQYYKESEVV